MAIPHCTNSRLFMSILARLKPSRSRSPPSISYNPRPDGARHNVAQKEPDMIANRSAPTAPVVPMLIYEDVAKAIDWLRGAFGFRERLRAPGRDGLASHAQLLAGTGDIVIGRAGGPFTAMRAGELHQLVLVEVDDVDTHYERAKAFGAEILQAPANMPFGARQYTASDLEGHWWTFSQNIADVHPSAWGAILKS
jgi:uncharacterized glyoxalase superfamily protein PhnB